MITTSATPDVARDAFKKISVKEALFLVSAGLLTAANFIVSYIPLFFLGILLFYGFLQRHGAQRSGFWPGYLYGMGMFTLGLYWIQYALHVDLSRFGWLIPICVLGIPAILSVFTGALSLFMKQCTLPQQWLLPWIFAACWTILEWIRGHILTGFPWGLIGYASLDTLLIPAQTAAYVGVYGLSFLYVGISASFYYIFTTPLALTKKWQNPVAFASLIFLVMITLGYLRLETQPTAYTTTSIKLIQPNIDQKMKWQNELVHDILFTHVTLSQAQPGHDQADIIIWPESACSWHPRFLQNDPERRHLLASLVKPNGFLITGSPRITIDTGGGNVFNSLFVIDQHGSIVETFDKFHLAPFGEYIPFRTTLESLFSSAMLFKISAGDRDFTKGPGPRTLAIANYPTFSPLICYEAIFPHEVVDQHQRPDWLLTLTNDAWFGDSPGPYQHLQLSRMRSIEEGLPLVRVANSGISAIIDPVGRMLQSIPLNQQGVIYGMLPQKLRTTAPLYTMWGDYPTLLVCLILLGFGNFSRMRQNRIRKN